MFVENLRFMDKNQKRQEVFDEKNGKMVPVYTNDDFVRALKERFHSTGSLRRSSQRILISFISAVFGG